MESIDAVNQRVLVLGIGGGSDAISAYAVAQALDVGARGEAIYGNTKSQIEPDAVQVAPCIYRLPEHERPLTGSLGRTGIDRALPRGPDGCPLICLLAKKASREPLQESLRSLNFDQAIAVDTGGDALETRSKRLGRDRTMLRVLQAAGLKTTLVVLGLGADGQASQAHMQDLLQAAQPRVRSRFSLAPLLPTYRRFADGLPERRTPRIILRAFEHAEAQFLVPRGQKPEVPLWWLKTGWVIELQPDPTIGLQ